MKKFSLSLLSFSILTAFSTNAWASDADNPALNPAIQSQTLGEVQVQGQRVSKVRPFSSSPTSDVFISNTDLKKRSNNLGEAIATEAGIHANSFGGGASAPVIRGQEGKRIRILTAGSETLDMSSMSPDHAITADGILAKQVEIFRGASTLMYSSGNSAGVVNVADSKIPSEVPENVTGEVGVRYNSANAERLTHLAVTAGVGKHLAVHAEGLYKKANDYKTPEYVYDGEPHRQVDNSFSQSKSGSLGVSWVGSQGFLGAAFTQRKDKYGLPAHSHLYDMYEARVMLDNATLRNTYLKYYPFLMDEQHINYNNPGLECKKRTYDWHVNACHNHNSSAAQNHEHDHDHGNPHIALNTKRWDVRGEWLQPFAGMEKIRFNAAHADYTHNEQTDSEVDGAFKNTGRNVRLEFVHQPWGRLRGVLGVQHLHQSTEALDNKTLAHYRQNLLHDHKASQNSIFLVERLDLNPVQIDFSARAEQQKIAMNYNLHYVGDKTKTGLVEVPEHLKQPHKSTAYSYAISANWQVNPQHQLHFTASRLERSPNSQELYAHGKHLATNAFEIGNKNLNKERSSNFELGWAFKGQQFDAKINTYYNHFSNYIYLGIMNDGHCTWRKNNKCSRSLNDVYSLQLQRYNQADARIFGVEAKFGYQFTPRYYASVFVDALSGKLKNLPSIPTGYTYNGSVMGWRTQANGYAPRMPSARVGLNLEGKFSERLTGDVQLYHVFDQNKVAYLEKPTKGHTMLNVGLNYQHNIGKFEYDVFMQGTNLLNDKVYQHTSALPYLPAMGRSLSVGANVKF